jgi:hypothetical protein
MSGGTSALGRANSSFALAAAISILVNTVLACAKDASKPLKDFMASICGHDWTTQGIFVVILFVLLGLIISKTNLTGKIAGTRLVSLLVGSTVLAGVVLFGWYVLY